MKLALFATLALIAAPAAAEPVRVKAHTTKDGTYVPAHTRSAPNSTKVDNWSSKPNVNPYTGKEGTVDPYAPTTYKPYKPKKY